MYRGYVLYGLIVLAWFGYAQYQGWSLGGGRSDSSRGGGWHWNWGNWSGSSGGGSWGGGYHK